MSDPILSPRSSFQDNVLIIEDDGHSFEEEIHQTQLESARKFLWDDDVLNSSGKSLPHFRTAQIPSLGLLDVQDFDQEDIDLQEDNDIEVQEDKEIDFHFQEDKDTDFREDKEENKGDTSRTTLVFTQIPKILDEDELPKSKSSSTQRTSLSIQATSLVPSVFKRKSGFNGDGYDDFLFVDKSLVQDSFDYSTGNKRKYRCVRALMAICLLASLLIWALFYTNMYASFGIKETMNTERFEALTIKLVEDHSVPELALGTAGSPQNNALHWIANQDPSQIDIEDKFLIQRYALAVLFFATSGTPAYGYFAVPGSDWVNQANWMTREGYCGWHGVECVGNLTDGNADVFGLNLTSNGLVGNLVPEIEVFKKLDRLDMSLNELGGTIPVELAQLRSLLRSVSLYGNNFTGPILENFGAMTNLRELDLGSNSLTGEMPESLGEATSLKKLNLEENNLNGTISSNWEYMTKLGE